MALYDAALPVVEKLLRSDEDALFERLGILSLQLRRDLATGASFDPQLEHDAAIMGPLDEVRDLGQRLFVRLEREAHALVCGSSEIDLRDREDLRSAFGLTEAAIAATLSAALVAHLGVAAPIAAVVAAIVIRRVGAAGHDVFCVRWKERLSG